MVCFNIKKKYVNTIRVSFPPLRIISYSVNVTILSNIVLLMVLGSHKVGEEFPTFLVVNYGNHGFTFLGLTVAYSSISNYFALILSFLVTRYSQ